MRQDNNITKTQLLIQGGSYVGLSLAIAVKQACPFLSITIIEARNANYWQGDERSFALSAAAKRMLDQLDIWQHIKDHAQPIQKMVITDSKPNDPIRPVFLTFYQESSIEAFAYMIETKILLQNLYQRAQDLSIEIIHNSSIERFAHDNSFIEAILSKDSARPDHKLRAELLVASDGVNSPLRRKAGIKTLYWPYNQMGLVCTVQHERDHEACAYEHFLPAGPFAILPLKNKRSSLVWSEESAKARDLLASSVTDAKTPHKTIQDSEFFRELRKRFGHIFGDISIISQVKGFPLGLRLARDFIAPHFALIGDSAHGIHPIAGQGLNLGFRDAALLAQLISEQARLGLLIGSRTMLENYQMKRRFETLRMAITTDILNRLFSNHSDFWRFCRDIGLGLVDRNERFKNYLIKEAAGLSPDSPRLLQGKPI